MFGAYYSSDYFYINHNGKYVTFNFKSKKRVKTKVLNFIKKEHQEAKINEFLKDYNLKLQNIASSKKYLHYDIIDL